MGYAQIGAQRADPMRLLLCLSPQAVIDSGSAQLRLRQGGPQSQQ
jgi:hypothetical protein